MRPEVIAKIKDQLADHKILLYMKGTPSQPQCGFSAQAVKALNACKAQFSSVDILEDPELRETLKEFSKWPTYPQLYINGELIGGCDIMLTLLQSGELQQLIHQTQGV
jgi:monothiol glutaredoxin